MRGLFIFFVLIGLPVAAMARIEELQISDAKTPEAALGESAPVMMYIKNLSGAAKVLVGAESPMADQVVLQHFVQGSNGLRHVETITKLAIPPKGEVIMAPDGLELMMLGLKQDLQMDYDVPVTLKFQDGQTRSVRVHVIAD